MIGRFLGASPEVPGRSPEAFTPVGRVGLVRARLADSLTVPLSQRVNGSASPQMEQSVRLSTAQRTPLELGLFAGNEFYGHFLKRG